MQLDAKAPATLGAVVEAVTRLSTLSEAKILELVSAGGMAELFPFLPASDQPVAADTVAENDLVEATALPLGRERREVLLEASLPAGKAKKKRASTKR